MKAPAVSEVLELKTVNALLPVHNAHILTYLKLKGSIASVSEVSSVPCRFIFYFFCKHQ